MVVYNFNIHIYIDLISICLLRFVHVSVFLSGFVVGKNNNNKGWSGMHEGIISIKKIEIKYYSVYFDEVGSKSW